MPTTTLNVFEKIMAPIIPLIEKTQNNLYQDAASYKLSFFPFTTNILFAIFSSIQTISILVTEIKTSDNAKSLNLLVASKSMYSEAFARYSAESFRLIFLQLVTTLSFMSIPDIQHLGQIMLVDGSLFPAISTMEWAAYKSTANAIKLQLSFNLNKMIPVQFLTKEGNYSEKKFLQDILEEGITYVCDRGYISFKLFKEICRKCAFFIIRGKNKMNYIVEEYLEVNIPTQFLNFLTKIQDIKVIFNTDKDKNSYRIVRFCAMGEVYVLITNRFDLTTYEIIMLYAYRWQIELCFRFLKRTLGSIHLMSHNPEGVQIQIYLYMIMHLLLLNFKQKCLKLSDAINKEETRDNTSPVDPTENKNLNDSKNQNGRLYVRGLVSMLGEGLKKYWKIGIHWLKAVQNSLQKKFDRHIALELAHFD